MDATATAVETASPVQPKQIITAEQLLGIYKPGRRFELIKGELREMSPAGSRHGRIAMRLGALLEHFTRSHNLGVVYAAETGFKLHENPDTVRAADAAFVAQERIPAEGEPDGFWAIAPDLVVEVVSPGDKATEIQSKATGWLEAGCRAVWVVYPHNQTVVVYHSLTDIRVLTADQSLEGGDVLSGFSITINQIFT